jgi:hypothetical protein
MDNQHSIGDNSHGFVNEQLLVKALNGKKYKELNTCLKKFISQICTDHSITIDDDFIIKSKLAQKELDPITNKKINVKPDLYIELGGKEYGISTKMGTGNSCHQEKIESFINWIKNNDNICVRDESIYDELRFFAWGDGTLDGTAPIVRDSSGNVIGRFGTKHFYRLYPDKHKKIKSFLDENRKEIIRRAVFLGKTGKEVHYIYHGTPINGVWISQKELLDLNLNNPLNNNTFNVGRLSFQIYNADLKGTSSGRGKRGEIQLKYGQLEPDIEKLLLLNSANIGTYEGNLEEFNFSKMMNKDKSHKFWSYLKIKLNLDDTDNYYVVKVDGTKFSKNANKKVPCKTDNYLIRTNEPIDRQLLFQNEYQLTESDLAKINQHKVIAESGISTKRKKSKKYTITKMSVNSFTSAFSPYLDNLDYFSAALIFYCTENNVSKNYIIAKDLGINENDFIEFIKTKFGVTINSLLDYESLAIITTKVKDLITQVIDNNMDLKTALFSGKGWFDAPYYINFLYSSGQLTDQIFVPYIIDNGSQRSKGKYTIIIKPK